MNKDLITPDVLAERWNLNPTTLSQWRWNGRGPQYLKLGRRVMYRIQDVEAFEEQQVRRDTSQGFTQQQADQFPQSAQQPLVA